MILRQLVLIAFVATSAYAAIHLPDPRTGVIDGHVATLVWPARNGTRELLPTDGCTGHLVPLDDLNSEEIRPCGEWFQPATGRYKVWLQGLDYISPSPTILICQRDLPGDRGLPAVLPVVPAGRVAASPRLSIPAGHGLRLLSLGTTSLQRAFDRRVSKAHEPTLMPAGKALAGVFHRETGEAIALSRPIDIVPGKTTIVAPESPSVDSDVFAVLERPRLVVPEQLDPVKLLLNDDHGSHAPDVVLDSPERVYAVWYGVAGRSAQLRIESGTLSFPAATLALRPRRVVTLRSRMSLLPRVGVSIVAPADAFKKMGVELRRADDPTILQRLSVEPGKQGEFLSAPADRLRVTLLADDWQFEQTADLRDGRDANVVFTLEPVVVRGTVYWGRDPAPAAVEFQISDDKWITAKAGHDGVYEARLWETGQFTTRVSLADSSAPPLLRAFTPVERDRPLDFHVPKTHIEVRAHDADTGRPITGARIAYTSVFNDANGPPQRIVQSFATDETGMAVLPPIRKGEVKIVARASGYVDSDPQIVEIQDGTERTLDFALHRGEVTVRTRVVLGGGTPAAGAEARVIDGAAPDRLLWRGVAGADGTLEIAAPVAGAVLIVRHAAGAAFVHPLTDIRETIQLGPPAPPLTITATAASGDPVRSAALTIWIEGVRLSGPSAAFAAWIPAAAVSSDGTATLRNLPAAPLRLLATRRAPVASVAAGAYDALTATITWPWGTAVKVQAAD